MYTWKFSLAYSFHPKHFISKYRYLYVVKGAKVYAVKLEQVAEAVTC